MKNFKAYLKEKNDPCWDGYQQRGTKKKDGKEVPNCIPEGAAFEIIEISEKEKADKPLNKPFRTPGGPKKFSVYVKNSKGNIVKVNFGDPNLSIKRDNPERRKAFNARHNCSDKNDKTKAGYWSCKMWQKNKSVGDMTEWVINETFSHYLHEATGDTSGVSKALQEVLADTIVIYYKTHSAHWNIEGANFVGLHDLFKKQYEELDEAMDEIAERLRALDNKVPSQLTTIIQMSSIKDDMSDNMSNEDIVQMLIKDNEYIAKVCLEEVIKAAEAIGDQSTLDLVTGRITAHEKAAWMLKSILK